MAFDLGTGASVSFSSGSIGAIRSITMPEIAIEDIESSHLGTTNYKTFLGGDLADPGEASFEIVWDPESDALHTLGTPDVMTVTWPVSVSGQTAASFVADGYFKSDKLPDLNLEELQVGNATFKLNGEDTEPALNAETA